MYTLIVYRTNHGCVEKCANMLAQRLNGKVEVQNLKNAGSLNLTSYESIIIGGSIYAGRIQKEVSEFCTRNMETLKNKRLGLFICGMQNEARETELNASFPKELLENSAAKEFFGGEFIFKKANFMERMIIKMIAKTDKDVLNLSEETIDSFANQMNA
jgi:menaquinone-dependent protoporphyrinogen oxidase